MEGDTQGLPADTGQVAEPLSGTEPSEPSLGTSTNEPADVTPEPPPAAAPVTPEPPPRQWTPEEIEERAFQRTASWTGRELKKFSDAIIQNVTQALDSRVPRNPAPAPPPSTDPATMLENPDAWAEKVFPKIMDREISRRTQAEQGYTSELIRQAAAVMDNDPLFTDKELGNAVVGEIQKNFSNANRNVDPGTAAQLLVHSSLANVYRQRSVKGNGLAGNRPHTGPMGTITPPAAAVAKGPAIKIEDMTKRVAGYFGNTPEQIQEFLK
jgi:hypothetical protein